MLASHVVPRCGRVGVTLVGSPGAPGRASGDTLTGVTDVTCYEFDTWNRLQRLTYPDGEHNRLGGALTSACSTASTGEWDFRPAGAPDAPRPMSPPASTRFIGPSSALPYSVLLVLTLVGEPITSRVCLPRWPDAPRGEW